MQLTKAQEREQTFAIEAMIAGLKGVSDDALLMAVEAVIEARTDIHPHKLTAFAHRMSGRAWDMQRESR